MTSIEIDTEEATICQCPKCKDIHLIHKRMKDRSAYTHAYIPDELEPVVPEDEWSSVYYNCKKCRVKLREVGDVVVDVY